MWSLCQCEITTPLSNNVLSYSLCFISHGQVVSHRCMIIICDHKFIFYSSTPSPVQFTLADIEHLYIVYIDKMRSKSTLFHV